MSEGVEQRLTVSVVIPVLQEAGNIAEAIASTARPGPMRFWSSMAGARTGQWNWRDRRTAF